MIVQKDGEQFTVDTTNKEIDVILYFPKLSADKGLESIGTGSMRDKGKELIDQAREVRFRKLETFKNKVKDGYNSTRHKSQGGEAHIDESMVFNNSSLFKTLIDSDFREDRLSQANQEKQRQISSAGKKDNKEKPQLSLLFKQFPLALEAISKCSEYGHEKYKDADSDYLNFKRVDGGSKTYADAGLRHRLEQGLDKESGLPHAWHTAWNALAELQLILENK